MAHSGVSSMADAAGSGLATKAANRRARVQIFGGKQRRVAGPRNRFTNGQIKRFRDPVDTGPAFKSPFGDPDLFDLGSDDE